MRLTIFAATGGIGRRVLEQAEAAGHEVTAVVRNPEALPANVPTITADLAEPDMSALESAVDGADAVVSGLGPRRGAEFGVTSKGTQAIIEAMKATAARRLIVVSVGGIQAMPTPNRPNPPTRDPGASFFLRRVLSPMAKFALGRHYADVALMEDHLRDSGLDWTSVQVPMLTNKPATGKIRTAYGQSVYRGYRLSRADAASFMLQVIDRPETFGRSIGIAH